MKEAESHFGQRQKMQGRSLCRILQACLYCRPEEEGIDNIGISGKCNGSIPGVADCRISKRIGNPKFLLEQLSDKLMVCKPPLPGSVL